MTRTLLAVAVLLAACAPARPRPTAHTPPLAGKPLALSAPDLAGREVRVEAPGRVVVVDFFASWCDPCRLQLPHLATLARELGPRGLVAYGVAVDERREAVEGFAGELGVEFPILWDPGGDGAARPLGVERLPTTILVDRRGVVRHVHVGYDARVEEQVAAEVRALLAE